jgi:hypothetical protein
MFIYEEFTLMFQKLNTFLTERGADKLYKLLLTMQLYFLTNMLIVW